jgi:chemotaxis protein methyltransferase CheR
MTTAADWTEGDREFLLTDRDFRLIADLVRSRAGIDLGPNKRSLVYGRLARRLRQLGLQRFSDYLPLLEDPDTGEAVSFLDAITTNVTDFFRENHHFEMLAGQILPEIWRRHARDRRVRFWSSACSTGEEPYSLAMVVRENPPPQGIPWDIRILATDISTNVLSVAKAGVYAQTRMRNLSRARLQRWFSPAGNGQFRIDSSLQSLVTFKSLNLFGHWPFSGPFDIIFCRNVIIYFNDENKRLVVKRLWEKLSLGGTLFLGHSESLAGGVVGAEHTGKTAYRKPGTP